PPVTITVSLFAILNSFDQIQKSGLGKENLLFLNYSYVASHERYFTLLPLVHRIATLISRMFHTGKLAS
ncbi:MAG TPA: hypothetical protein VFR47_31745, partial [Anaerolineales bacterium]|nr:hypothetical protein [Anaerolineales bacterium]